MERHDATTRRPSLLAGGEEPTGARRPRERILPSIDTADAGVRAPRGFPRALPWMLGGLLALVAIGLLAPWRAAPGPGHAPPPPTAAPDRVGSGDPRGAATIIDDAALPTEVAVGPSRAPAARADTPAPAGDANDPSSSTAPASPFAAMAPAGNAANPFGATTAPALADRPVRPGPVAPVGDSEALLATLLGHIQSAPAPATPMDRMVERLAREEPAPTQASAPPVQFRSFQIQMNLRDCPPANTTEGVACRARICEVYAGRDPACPAG